MTSVEIGRIITHGLWRRIFPCSAAHIKQKTKFDDLWRGITNIFKDWQSSKLKFDPIHSP